MNKYRCICGKEREIKTAKGLSRRCPYCGLTYARSEEIRVGTFLEAQHKMKLEAKVGLLQWAHRLHPRNHDGEMRKLILSVEENLEEAKGFGTDVHYLLADFYFEGHYVREDMAKVARYINGSIALHGRNKRNAALKLIADSEEGRLKPGEFEGEVEKLAKGAY